MKKKKQKKTDRKKEKSLKQWKVFGKLKLRTKMKENSSTSEVLRAVKWDTELEKSVSKKKT